MKRILSIILSIFLVSLIFICSAVSKNRDADFAQFDEENIEENGMAKFNFINYERGRLSRVKKISDISTEIVVRTETKPVIEYHMQLDPHFFRYGYVEGDLVLFTFGTSTASYPPSYSNIRPVFIFRSGPVDRAKILDPGVRKLLKRESFE